MHAAVNEMRSYKGNSERTLQHSLADIGRRNGRGNEREKRKGSTPLVGSKNVDNEATAR